MKRAEELLANNPGSIVFARYAEELYNGGEVDKAVSILRKGIEANPYYASGHAVLSRILYERGETEEADEAMKTALHLDPQAPHDLHEFGSRLLGEEKSDLALPMLWAALRFEPEIPELREVFERTKSTAEKPMDLFLSEQSEAALRAVTTDEDEETAVTVIPKPDDVSDEGAVTLAGIPGSETDNTYNIEEETVDLSNDIAESTGDISDEDTVDEDSDHDVIIDLTGNELPGDEGTDGAEDGMGDILSAFDDGETVGEFDMKEGEESVESAESAEDFDAGAIPDGETSAAGDEFAGVEETAGTIDEAFEEALTDDIETFDDELLEGKDDKTGLPGETSEAGEGGLIEPEEAVSSFDDDLSDVSEEDSVASEESAEADEAVLDDFDFLAPDSDADVESAIVPKDDHESVDEIPEDDHEVVGVTPEDGHEDVDEVPKDDSEEAGETVLEETEETDAGDFDSEEDILAGMGEESDKSGSESVEENLDGCLTGADDTGNGEAPREDAETLAGIDASLMPRETDSDADATAKELETAGEESAERSLEDFDLNIETEDVSTQPDEDTIAGEGVDGTGGETDEDAEDTFKVDIDGLLKQADNYDDMVASNASIDDTPQPDDEFDRSVETGEKAVEYAIEELDEEMPGYSNTATEYSGSIIEIEDESNYDPSELARTLVEPDEPVLSDEERAELLAYQQGIYGDDSGPEEDETDVESSGPDDGEVTEKDEEQQVADNTGEESAGGDEEFDSLFGKLSPEEMEGLSDIDISDRETDTALEGELSEGIDYSDVLGDTAADSDFESHLYESEEAPPDDADAILGLETKEELIDAAETVESAPDDVEKLPETEGLGEGFDALSDAAQEMTDIDKGEEPVSATDADDIDAAAESEQEKMPDIEPPSEDTFRLVEELIRTAPDTEYRADADDRELDTLNFDDLLGAYEQLIAADGVAAESAPDHAGEPQTDPGPVRGDTAPGEPIMADYDSGEGGGEDEGTATMAEIYVSQGLLNRAVRIYEKIAKRNPDNEKAVRRLAELRAALEEESS